MSAIYFRKSSGSLFEIFGVNQPASGIINFYLTVLFVVVAGHHIKLHGSRIRKNPWDDIYVVFPGNTVVAKLI
jgi:hypothetical protein